jgi:hypothetical protein
MVQHLGFGIIQLEQTRSWFDDKPRQLARIGKNGQESGYLRSLRSCGGTS